MVHRDQLSTFLEDLLQPPRGMDDGSNNGLQVEGADEIHRVAFAVDACEAVFGAAHTRGADALVVHHGLSWGGGIERITGTTARRLRLLLSNGISLFAYHLPLDWHPECGNNAVIARRLELLRVDSFCTYGGIHIGRWGDLPRAIASSDLVDRVSQALRTRCRTAGPEQTVQRIGIVSGGGGSAVDSCPPLGIECLITGELGHQHVHEANERGVTVIEAGHYRTEVCGVRAVIARIADSLDVECCFIAMPTGF